MKLQRIANGENGAKDDHHGTTNRDHVTNGFKFNPVSTAPLSPLASMAPLATMARFQPMPQILIVIRTHDDHYWCYWWQWCQWRPPLTPLGPTPSWNFSLPLVAEGKNISKEWAVEVGNGTSQNTPTVFKNLSYKPSARATQVKCCTGQYAMLVVVVGKILIVHGYHVETYLNHYFSQFLF